MGNIANFINQLHNDLENLISQSKIDDKPLKYWAFVQKEQDFYRDGNYILLQLGSITKEGVILAKKHVDFEVLINMKSIFTGQNTYVDFVNAIEQLIEYLYFYQYNGIIINDIECTYTDLNTYTIKLIVKGVEI